MVGGFRDWLLMRRATLPVDTAFTGAPRGRCRAAPVGEHRLPGALWFAGDASALHRAALRRTEPVQSTGYSFFLRCLEPFHALNAGPASRTSKKKGKTNNKIKTDGPHGRTVLNYFLLRRSNVLRPVAIRDAFPVLLDGYSRGLAPSSWRDRVHLPAHGRDRVLLWRRVAVRGGLR